MLGIRAKEFSSWPTALLSPWILPLWVPAAFSLLRPLVLFPLSYSLCTGYVCGCQRAVRASGRGMVHATLVPASPWSGTATDGHCIPHLSVTPTQTVGPRNPARDWSHEDTGTSWDPPSLQGPFSRLSPMSRKERWEREITFLSSPLYAFGKSLDLSDRKQAAALGNDKFYTPLPFESVLP